MSRRQNKDRDPAIRAAKRARQREAAKRSTTAAMPSDPMSSQSQMTHASSGKAIKKRREGERRMQADRDADD